MKTNLAFAAICLAACVPSVGFAGSRADCAVYADEAVRQYREMKAMARCERGDSARWQANRKNHFGWCLTASADAYQNERGLRDKWLLKCGARIKFDEH